jgi:hypothetical protein
MGTRIVCFYIETKDQGKLESLLLQNGDAFYDATESDLYTQDDTPWSSSTLEEIEAYIEGK